MLQRNYTTWIKCVITISDFNWLTLCIENEDTNKGQKC